MKAKQTGESKLTEPNTEPQTSPVSPIILPDIVNETIDKSRDEARARLEEEARTDIVNFVSLSILRSLQEIARHLKHKYVMTTRCNAEIVLAPFPYVDIVRSLNDLQEDASPYQIGDTYQLICRYLKQYGFDIDSDIPAPF